MLQELGDGAGFLKAGLYGNAGSGKTHTATLFAIGLRKHLKMDGRIGFFDTETGIEYVAPMIREATGAKPVGYKSRALSDAINFIHECVKANVAIGVIDSVTHIWEEVQKSYLKQLNEARRGRGRSPQMEIQWQDRGPLNAIWQQFTDAFLNAPMHIILCGRAANIWERSVNEETGKVELNRTGTKMKTQSELAYEPSLLAEMEREQEIKEGKQVIYRTMTVLKDRWRDLDGKQFVNPTFESILPHIAHLTPGVVNAVDTTRETNLGVSDDGDTAWHREKKDRTILQEQIANELVKEWPGTGEAQKKMKIEALERNFGINSWTAIESMKSEQLRIGLNKLRAEITSKQPGVPSAPKAEEKKEVKAK